MTKILFVCHGNICRSPMAEYIFKKIVNDKGLSNDFLIASAATSREEIGNDIYPPAKRMLSSKGIPFDIHHARQISKEDLSTYDFIICMEQYNIHNLERLLGPSEKYSLLLDYTDIPGNISDPWYSGDFDTAYNEIYKGCEAFLRYISK